MQSLRSQALSLPEPERASLAHDLVKSLDGPMDPGAATQWDAEILRRIQSVAAGTANIIDREEFRRLARERIRKL